MSLLKKRVPMATIVPVGFLALKVVVRGQLWQLVGL
jgi:hypothetical protein